MYLWTIRQKGMGFSLKTWWSIEQCSIHKKKSIWELAHDIDFFLWLIYGESRIWARSGADCECCIAKSAWVYSQAGLLFWFLFGESQTLRESEAQVDTIFLILKKFHYFLAEKVVKFFWNLNFVSFFSRILSDLLQKQQEK